MIMQGMIGPVLVAGLLTGAADAALAQVDATQLYTRNCSACHGMDGSGIPGVAPPLARPGFWAALGDQAPVYLSSVMVAGLSGRIEAGGMTYVGAMPRQNRISNEDIVALTRYVLSTFGEMAENTEVTLEAVAALQADRPDHAALVAMRPAGE